MTEKETFHTAEFFMGCIAAFFITFILMQMLGINKWHDRTCQEQFGQAVTASDSLTVIVEDSYCNTELDRG